MSLKLCLLACLLGAVYASKDSAELKATKWLSSSQLENVPSVNDITWERLENEPLQRGAELVEKVYHLAHIKHDLTPNFVPSSSNIPVWLVKPNGQRVQWKLNNFVDKVKTQEGFGDDEVTIVLTGLPETTPTIKKAMRKLEQAYMQRYNLQEQQKHSQTHQHEQYKSKDYTSSEEAADEWKSAKTSSGNLIIIDVGATLTTFKRYAMLDVASTGAMIGEELVELMKKCDVLPETMHLIGQGISAHVAGAAGNHFTSQTGLKLRRITGLDPAKILAKKRSTLVGLSRGDAEFVDCIHTSALSLGTPIRSGDVDFYPNGPSQGVPGAENVIEAVMRATRYFAESVRPGNERNFPAVPANSLQQYKNNNGFGKRALMGIQAAYDLQGDYILEVNAKSPFGQRTAAQQQISYHGKHQI